MPPASGLAVRRVFPSLHGVPTDRSSPASSVLWGGATPAHTSRRTRLPSHGDTTHWLAGSLPSPANRGDGPGVVRPVSPAGNLRGCSRSLTFLGNPVVRVLCSSTPVGPADQAIQPADAAPASSQGEGSSQLRISRLNRTASALAVYASQAGSPPHHARLASGRRPALPDGIGYPQDSIERFQVCVLHVHPPFPSVT
jgi:hypothetical protein